MVALSLIKFFHGYVYVHLTGYAPERFLNLCGNHNILIWNLTPCEDGYFFYISVKGYRSLKPILKKTRTKAAIIEKKGLPFKVFRYRKRKIFLLGIFLFAGMLYYLSGFIWNIEVTGNSYLSEDTIIRFLKANEASFGTKITDINCESLEDALRTEYSEVIWTSIKIYGTKMTIDLQESLLPEEDYVKQDDSIYDIIAAKDGTIIEMVTRNGTPLVTDGVEVKKGDLLVCGRVDVLGDDGLASEYLYHSADADILGKVSYSYQDEINIVYQDKIVTGNQKDDYQLEIMGMVVKNPFFKNLYEQYDVTEDVYQLHFTDNFYLPISVKKIQYAEYQIQEKEYSEDEIKEIAEAHFLQYLTNLEEKGIQIIEKNVMIEKVNQKYEVSGSVWVYESLVSYQPTEVLQITTEEGQLLDESD